MARRATLATNENRQNLPHNARSWRGPGPFLTETPPTDSPKHLFRPLFPRNPLFPALRSGPTTVSEASRQKQIPSSNRKILRSTGKVPAEVWEQQLLDRTAKLRATPESSLLDLHLSLRATRKVHLGHLIQFDGRDYEIAPTSRKSVTVLFHPFRKFWVLEHPPKLSWPTILGSFTLR